MPGSDNGGIGGSGSSAAPFTLKEPLGTSTGASGRDKVELSMSMHQAGKPFGKLEEAEEETRLQRWWTFLCGTPGRACLGCCALILIAIIIIVPIVVLVITPIIVNMFVNATTMTVINASLAEPTTDTMVVQAFVELNNAGPLPATLRGFNATMYDNSGRDIGWLVFPDFDLDSNSANLQEVVSLLTITNTEAIYEEGLKMLAGKPVSWTVRGSTSIVALGFGFNVDIEKPLTFPGVYLDNFQTKNVRINHANATMNYIVMDADLEFTSVSTLEFLRIGTLRSDLWYNMDANNATKHGFSKVYREFYGSRLCTPQMKLDGECANGWEVSENIGWCDMFDFKVARGVNRIKAQIFLYNTKTNGYNLGRWVSQWEQTIISVGPINKFFLNRIWQGLVTLEAGPEKMFTGALGTKQTFVQGYNTQTGANCDFYNQGGDVCDKGAIIMAKNPFDREWALKKIEYDVFFEEEYEYDATFNINAAPNSTRAGDRTALPVTMAERQPWVLDSTPGVAHCGDARNASPRMPDGHDFNPKGAKASVCPSHRAAWLQQPTATAPWGRPAPALDTVGPSREGNVIRDQEATARAQRARGEMRAPATLLPPAPPGV